MYANGFNDIFLAEYDNNGNELWVKQFGGNNPVGQDERGGIVIDKVNNYLYFSGRFYGTMVIDNDTVTSTSIDPFLAKFDFSGNCEWVIKASSPGTDDRGMAQIVDNNTGTIYWTGILQSNGTLDTFNLQKGSFLAKVSSRGDVIWAKTEFIDIDPVCFKQNNNSLYFGGVTRNDTVSVDTSLLIANYDVDAFLCNTDTNGNVIWAKRFGGDLDDYLTSFDFDSNNNLFLSGTFKDTLIYGSDTISTSAFRDCFIAKMNPNGNLVWIRQTISSNNGNAWGSGLISDVDGNTYLIGKIYTGTTNFGQFTINTTNIMDMFLTRYDSNGNCLGIRQFGYAEGYGVQIDAFGKVYCSGIFYNTISIGSNMLVSHGDADIFIAKSDAITGLGGYNRVQQNQLVIYANPNKGTFNIKVPDDIKTFKDAMLIVYDNTGKETAQFTLDGQSDVPRFDVSNAVSGIYTVKLVQAEKIYIGKMVVE